MTEFTAAKIFSLIMSSEPSLGEAGSHSVFDALKDEPEDRPYTDEDWAVIADVALEAMAESDDCSDALDAVYANPNIRAEVGRLMMAKAIEIKAASDD